MTARVLVVDDVLPNVKLLEAKLLGEYFDVMTATSGPEALELIHREMPDIVLLDVMMPGMNGFEVCKRIKGDSKTAHIPVVMVTALDKQSDRIAGLDAGADDFLTKPVEDVALFARVRSLVRLKVTMDEIRNRESTEMSLGATKGMAEFNFDPGNTQILLLDEDPVSAKKLASDLKLIGKLHHLGGGKDVISKIRERDYDLVIINLLMSETDGLRVCSQMRSYEETRQLPILVVVDNNNTQLLVKALEMGVNDYLIAPADELELIARVKTQIKRKRYAEQLRENLHLSLQLATTDAVTGLYNRHYMSSHLDTLVKAAKSTGKEISLVMMDLDNFKLVNDNYGHASGDEVLQEFSQRIARNIRGVDLAARYGGEEFVIIMPDTRSADAVHISERLRATTADLPFLISGNKSPIQVTTSIGLVTMVGDEVNAKELLRRADTALYQAKESGRNCVIISD
ncbi:MAG: PleD family two-component system response regulator [Sphingomonadales bacterium]|nr:PleD family two-component system response regulator [Sphingomonadales bacterium]